MKENSRITNKQKQFCIEYLIDFNATQAAIRTGYSPRSARQIGSDLLTKHDNQQEIQRIAKNAVNKTEVSVERIVKEYADIAFSDIGKLFDENGKLLELDQIDKGTASALKQYTVRKSKNKSQEITKIVFHDKISALNVLAKYLNLDKYQDRP